MNPRGTSEVIKADALDLPIPDESVDLIITSPPYFALRSYRDGGEHYDGQVGSEDTPGEFVDALIVATREMVRVLKPSGSIWVNLGDKYAGSGGHNNGGVSKPDKKRKGWDAAVNPMATAANATRRNAPNTYNKNTSFDGAEMEADRRGIGQKAMREDAGLRRLSPAQAGVRSKSLMGLPWRYAIRCIDELGLILRAEIVWDKPNGLPESVGDRVRRSHEQWFHFVKSPSYFAAIDEVRETHVYPSDLRGEKWRRAHVETTNHHHHSHSDPNPLGKLPGSVWRIPSEPLKVPEELGVDHFAAFPSEWPRRIILGWSPSGICTACGEGRRPVVGVDWSKVPHRMVEKRVLSPDEKTAWVLAFRQWCEERNIKAQDLDRAAGTKDMGGHWMSRPSQHEVPTPEQWERLGDMFGPMPGSLSAVVYATEVVPVALADYGVGDKEISGRHKNDFAQVMNDGEYRSITGYACQCPDTTAPTTPATVLDPFGGTGTTAMVAKALGRKGISVDLSADYCRLAEWRCNDEASLVKAREKTYGPKPLKVNARSKAPSANERRFLAKGSRRLVANVERVTPC
jgi:DNA modification methylase